MCSDTDSEYAILAPYVRAMLKSQGVLSAEVDFLYTILSDYAVAPGARILDGACGSGDSLARLASLGFRNIAGIDSSVAMLAQAKALPELRSVPLERACWQRFDEYFNENGTFDLVFILGNSIAHAAPEQMPTIMSRVRDGLTDGGLLVFDFRGDWLQTKSGLRQKNRREEQWREIAAPTLGVEQFRIEDRCLYVGSRQHVEYRVSRMTAAGPECLGIATLRYSPFFERDAVQWIAEAGLTYRETRDWRYRALVASR